MMKNIMKLIVIVSKNRCVDSTIMYTFDKKIENYNKEE